MAGICQAIRLLAIYLYVVSVDSIAITGASGGINQTTGKRPFREEFNNFQNSGPAFDLYILALQYIQTRNQSHTLSYYQIAGIHGRPFIPWEGVDGPNTYAGYCTHSSILFPPWHRPYLALFEQTLWNNAEWIAQTYPYSQQATYIAAARTLRIPYWDWVANPSMPSLVNNPNITINAPDGQRTMANPLFTYAFNPQPATSDFPLSDAPLSTYPESARWPDDSGNSQPSLANAQLVHNGPAIHDSLYLLIAQQSDYAPFSNTGYVDGQGGTYENLEDLHNQIHGLVGGNGHMGWIPYAGFDPIFFLHHANVDRLFAIWQAIYPDSYVTPQVDYGGTFTINSGTTEDTNTPLTPFKTDNSGTFHTPTTARSTKTFGYTYPEIVDWGVNTTQLSANVRKAFNKLYNPSNGLGKRHLDRHKRQCKTSWNETAAAHVTETSPEYAAVSREWLIHLRVSKFALNGSFFIHFFLGLVPSDSTLWSLAPTLVASHVIFSASTSQNHPTTLVRGQVPLTRRLVALVSRHTISDLTPGSVTPYLRTNLHWRVQLFNSTVIPVGSDSMNSLKIYVADMSVIGGEREDEFPVFGSVTGYRNVTDGRSGGLGSGDRF
ncbi:MAG: hypothetical protein M1827_004678 [Pycnora praestabilis]|nr:MAG: hypothetical protein M1827_004678 [Pycnora praestabilis]